MPKSGREIYAGRHPPSISSAGPALFLRQAATSRDSGQSAPRHDRQRKPRYRQGPAAQAGQIADATSADSGGGSAPSGPPDSRPWWPTCTGRTRREQPPAQQVADIFNAPPRGGRGHHDRGPAGQIPHRCGPGKGGSSGRRRRIHALNLRAAVSGVTVGLVHDPRERENVTGVRLPGRPSSLDHLKTIRSAPGAAIWSRWGIWSSCGRWRPAHSTIRICAGAS